MYTYFLGEMSNVSRSLADNLSMEATESWSDKNWEICVYFWEKRFLSENVMLCKFGSSVRRSYLISLSLVTLSALFSLFGQGGS